MYTTSEYSMSHLFFFFCRRRQDNKFYDTCAKRLSYANWMPNEPNDAGGSEDCGHMLTYSANQGKWNDINCFRKFGYICQIKTPRCKYLIFQSSKIMPDPNLSILYAH